MSENANSKKIRESLKVKQTKLEKHIEDAKIDINVFNHSDCDFSAWTGASKMTQEDFFMNKFLTRKLYEEYGENIIRRHFFAFN